MTEEPLPSKGGDREGKLQTLKSITCGTAVGYDGSTLIWEALCARLHPLTTWPSLSLSPHPRHGRTRLMSVSYCRAEPELAVTTLARRKMPCSSSSFLIPRTWESRVCRSRSWRYFSFDPQMKSRSLRTCRRTNGVCWIIRYLRGETTQSQGLGDCIHTGHGTLDFKKKKSHEPSYFLTVELAFVFLTRTRRKKNIKKGKPAIFLLFLVVVLRNLQGSWSPLQSAQSETTRKKLSESFRLNRGEKSWVGVPLQFELVIWGLLTLFLWS